MTQEMRMTQEMHDWLTGALHHGGGFVRAVAEIGFRADAENLAILLPALEQFRAKYPKYEAKGREYREDHL